MDDYKNKLLNEILKLNERIKKKQKLLSVMGIQKGKSYSNALTTIKAMQSIINQCIQCGNYRRAMKLMIATNRLLDEYALHEAAIMAELTQKILEG